MITPDPTHYFFYQAEITIWEISMKSRKWGKLLKYFHWIHLADMVEDVEDILVDKVASDKKLGMTQVVLIVLRY